MPSCISSKMQAIFCLLRRAMFKPFVMTCIYFPDWKRSYILKFREVYVLLLYHPHLQGSQAGADLRAFLRGTVILWAHTQLQRGVKRVCSLRTPRQCSPARCEFRTHILHNCTKLFLACFSPHRKNVILPQLSDLLNFQNISDVDINHNRILKL